MAFILKNPDLEQKLEILSSDSRFDLACSCGASKDEHRKRGGDGRWIYPVALPNGGSTILFKSLISNVCTNDCKYCPLREEKDVRRVSLSPEETAALFMDYFEKKKVFGLFLSSGVAGSPDSAMQRLNTTAAILRKKRRFRGYIHLKIIPGASPAAIEEAVSLSSAVSLNIEVPGEKNLAVLSAKKNFLKDIVEPIKFISRLTAKGTRFERVKQTTQFVVGAAKETDAEIVKYMYGLYDRLNMHRIYFSAYQGENGGSENLLMREHRLYQVDFLVRKYGFGEKDIMLDDSGNLSLVMDPKEAWAEKNRGFFPLNINDAPKELLLRVPGIGHITAANIIKLRKACSIKKIDELGKVGVRLSKVAKYLAF